MKHPENKQQRLVAAKKRIENKHVLHAKKATDRAGHVRIRLSKENIKEQETYDELKEYQGH